MKVVAATQWPLEALAACFTAAFDGYIAGSFTMDVAALPRFLERQGADLALSRCVEDEGRLLGLAFVGEFAGRRRVGGMGVTPQARGTGASSLLLQQVIADTRAAGSAALELEVFAQNTAAVRLYRSAGFIEGAPLWGFERGPLGEARLSATTPRTLDRDAAADWLLALGRDDLPYQVSGHSVRRFDPAVTLWQAGSALLAFNVAASDLLTIPLLFDADPAQRDAAALLDTLLAAYPQHRIRVPQLMRDDVAGRALRGAGFTALPLHQLQMRLPLR